MKRDENELWASTFHGHDGVPTEVTATRDDACPEPHAWTCTCGATRSFPTQNAVFPTDWRHTHAICLDRLRSAATRLLRTRTSG
ncbi:hypothetical protein ACIF8W_28310 [Streptomyces sp. NPDC085639]|uniref:hypothetical protein n=1 Tax=Streptomyces sp. NPDC085639 TaxID=3365734 RepID=UPI0037D16D6F